MAGRLRRRSGFSEAEVEDGPFVSFTDLFIGILFLFLILVAALMLMHQGVVQTDAAETQQTAQQVRQMSGQMQQMKTKLESAAQLDARHPPFRLAIVFNAYQRPAGSTGDWVYSRTVQVFRSPDGLCINNVILRNNLNLAWKPPVKPSDIPTATNQSLARMGTACTISATEDQWNTDSETGGVKRVSADLYSGYSTLHRNNQIEPLEIQYRVLGVYDRHFR